jgi:hypothetical protein
VDAFGDLLRRTLDNVAQGRTTLRAASRTLEEYTAAHYPAYFNGLAVTYPGLPMRAKLARMLLSEFENDVFAGKHDGLGADRRAHLSQELAEIMVECSPLAPREESGID